MLAAHVVSATPLPACRVAPPRESAWGCTLATAAVMVAAFTGALPDSAWAQASAPAASDGVVPASKPAQHAPAPAAAADAAASASRDARKADPAPAFKPAHKERAAGPTQSSR